MMSFCQQAKKEIATRTESTCCRDAKLYGALTTGARLEKDGIYLRTESRALFDFVCLSVHERFGVTPLTRVTQGKRGSFFYIDIPSPDAVYTAFSIKPDDPFFSLNRSLLRRDCCKHAFLRGAFLGAGRLNNPQRGYSLEFVLKRARSASLLCMFLAENGYPPSMTRRGAQYVCYYRGSEAIEDLLNLMGATECAFSLMNEKIEKDVRNSLNRRGNCDLYNAGRHADAAAAQLADIEALDLSGRLAGLPPELAELAALRRDNPEASGDELGRLCEPPISKASVTRRFLRIREYLNQ